MKKLLLAICLISTCNVFAQTVNSRGPYASSLSRNDVASIKLPSVDVDKMLAEDKINNELKAGPWRFGKNFKVNYDLKSNGTWQTLDNGDRIWELRIEGTNALSLNFIFNQFHLPAGAELYLFSEETHQTIGAYSALNNSQSKVLGTELIIGNSATIQLYVPRNVSFEPSLKLVNITHGYRSMKSYAAHLARDLNDSGDCNVDVNCPLGDGWEDQIRAVAMIVVGGNGACTGTLLNNTKEDGVPYFLTANHCGSDVTNWAFRFNWESPTPSCATTTGSGPDSEFDTMNGAQLIASNSKSDFTLLKFNNDIPSEYEVYYAGWDKSDVLSGATTGIHHPSGDIKKICRDYETATHYVTDFNGNSATEMWKINDWDQGVTEPGSSGSALFDSKGRVIGQLAGGMAACNGTIDNNEEDWYGRFATSWDFGSTANARLKDWLDPLNIDKDTLSGWDPNAQLYANDAMIKRIDNIEKSYCDVDHSEDIEAIVVVKNQGFDPLTSFKLFYDYNESGLDSILVSNKNILPGESFQVNLPAYSRIIGDNSLETFVTSPNGVTDENPKNDSSFFDFSIATGHALNFLLQLDFYPEETSWSIKTHDDQVIDQGSNYTESKTINNNYCLAKDCFTFEINDSGNNGLEGFFSFFGTGTFNATNAVGDTIFNLHEDSLDFGSQTTRDFCLPSNVSISEKEINLVQIYPNPSSGVIFINSSYSDQKVIEVYNVIGKRVYQTVVTGNYASINLEELDAGNYIIQIMSNNVTQVEKIQLNH